MQSRISAGAYEIDITPPLGVDLAGYFNVRKADSILDNLYAKSVVLKDKDTEVAITSCDLCVIPREIVLAIRGLASQWSGIPEENIMISATHTHTGPVTTGLLAGEIDSTYIEILVKKIASSIAMAKKNLKEANVKVGKGEEQNLVFNRRYVMKDGSVKTNPGKLNPDIIRPAGPVDPDILVILLEDDIKNPIALLINYANHVDTIGGTGISADYPGILSRTLKRFLGDIPVLFLTGAEGDINHINVMDSNPQAGYEEAKRIGITLAGEVLKILVKLSLINGRLGIKSSFLNVPVRKPDQVEIDNAKKLLEETVEISPGELTAFDLAKGSLDVERVYAQEVIALSQLDRDFEELELQAISLGEVVFLGVPGEPFAEIGLAIKRESPFTYTGIVSLASGYSGYIPTEKAFNEGGYEIRLARSSKLDRATEKTIIREGITLINSIYK